MRPSPGEARPDGSLLLINVAILNPSFLGVSSARRCWPL